MIDAALKNAVENALALHTDKRVLAVDYKDKKYFVKRRRSNGRNRFAKADTSTAFWCETYKIEEVNQYFPLAPVIVLLTDTYFVLEDAGHPLQRIGKSPEFKAIQDHVFWKAGQSLSQLHAAGLHHGRPALRDIAYDIDKDKITFLDWENEKNFLRISPQTLDIFLFIHSCFRESRLDKRLVGQAVSGYCSVDGGSSRIQDVKTFIRRHAFLFAACRALSLFRWTDIMAVEDSRRYIETLSL